MEEDKVYIFKFNEKFVMWSFLIFVMISWGVAWPSQKILLSYIDPMSLNFIRMLLSAGVLLIILRYFKTSIKLDKAKLKTVSIGIVLGFLHYYLTLKGLEHSSALIGGVIQPSLIPLFSFVLPVIVYKIKTNAIQKIGVFYGVIGILTVLQIWNLSFQDSAIQGGYIFVFSSISWALVTMLTARKDSRVNMFVFAFYVNLGVALLSFLFIEDKIKLLSIFTDQKYDTIFWVNIVFMGVISSALSTSLYFMVTRKLGAVKTGTFIFMVPLAAAISSMIILGDVISIYVIIGGVITITALYLINHSSQNISLKMNKTRNSLFYFEIKKTKE